MSNRIKKQFWFTPEEEAEFRRKVALTGLPQSSIIRMLIKGYEPRERPDDRFFQAINSLNEMIHTAQKLLERSYQLGVVDKDTVEREIKRWVYFISNIESDFYDQRKVRSSGSRERRTLIEISNNRECSKHSHKRNTAVP